MAIFQTGSTATIPNLLDTLAAFCVANGWTQNFNAIEGSGRRVHLQKGADVFINLRALVVEQPYAGGNILSGISINGSTSYNGAQAWHNQPGYPVSSGVAALMAGIGGLSAIMPTYYFFARGDMIYAWFEYSTGNYQWLVFGKVSKTSTWTGGTLFAGNTTGITNNPNVSPNHGIAAGITSLTGGVNGNPNAYLYGVIGANTGWLPANNGNILPDMPRFTDTALMDSLTFNALANTFNGQAVLAPVELAIARDGAGNWSNNNTNFSIEAVLPDIYYTNIRYLVPGQQLDDGSGDIFRVLPFRTKTIDGSSSGFWAVAIKEN